jgi:adenine-specific DNA-methyltransferase
MHSPNFTEENIAKLAALFPGCVTESTDEDGNLKQSIDFDQLRQELSTHIVEGPQERYHLNWPGKREALLTANAPIAKTLRPCREESVDFDSTENLFIEGDNLDALKLLQENYLGKVKMIYIDPPYNTGNDFIYADDFAESTEEYLLNSGQRDEEGNRLISNTDSNGRFHSDWMSMMYSRLKLARNLLKDDGVIFISIDDGEAHNLIKMCGEIYGEQNYVANFVWQRKYGASNNSKGVAPVVDHIVCFSKTTDFVVGRFPRSQEAEDRYKNPDNDERGPWKPVDYWNPLSPSERPNLSYTITNPFTGLEIVPEKKAWKYSKEKYQEHEKDNRIYWGKEGTNTVPTLKRFLSEVDGGVIPINLWDWKFASHTDAAKKIINDLGIIGFSTPKPPLVIQRMLQVASTHKDDIILDFFAGSATTAHAVMQLNTEDGGRRKFIMVQIPEKCDEKSEAFKAGYINIAEIGKERIRRAGKKIKSESPITTQELDVGFRVLKVDSSNMADIYYTPDTIEQKQLSLLTDNIKANRTSEDLLFQVLLDWGVDLTLPITKETIENREVFFVDNNALAACFVKNGQITEDFCKELTKRQPLRVVFRDSGFKDDSVKINVEQIFKLMSPHTEVKCI